MLVSQRYQARKAPQGIHHFRSREQRLPADPRPAQDNSFTLATYNVKNLFDDKDQNAELGTTEKPEAELEALANNIASSHADVLTLQEVENLPVLQKFLQEHLPGVFQDVILVEGNDRRGIDVAVLSKFPVTQVVSHKDHQFPLADGSGQTSFNRDLLRVDLDVRGTPFTVYTSHFKSKRGGPRSDNERIAEAQETRRILAAEMAPFESRRFVVTGDLNDTPDSKTLRVLTEPYQGQPGLIDTLEGHSNNLTFPSKRPKEQIDHILYPPHMADQLLGSQVYRDGDSKLASDHLMVISRWKV